MNNIKPYKNKFTMGLVLILFIAMLIFPQATYKGASSGLLLWFSNVLPTLLPFVIISNLMIQLDITKQISKFLYPVLGKFFPISTEGSYPILIGFISGTPMGAKATADMVSNNKISYEEGSFLLTLCNNYSPVFIISYIAINQLNLSQIKYPLYLIILISSISSAMIYHLYTYKKRAKKKSLNTGKIFAQELVSNPKQGLRFNFAVLDNAIMNGFEVITKVGGYIMLFSILAMLLDEILSVNNVIEASLMGCLEITTGINLICKLKIANKVKIVLAAVLTSFGGLSAMAQTKSVLDDSRLSMKSYIIVKLISAIITFLLTFIYVSIIPIA